MVNIKWEELGFEYIKTPFRYISHWKNGQWDAGELTEDNTITINEGSTCLHYGQECFEGLKAYRRKDGNINLFRPDENSKRMNKSAARLQMPDVPEDKFIDAVMQVVRANEEYVPPYGTGATLYLRPYLIGVGPNIGVVPAPEYILVCSVCQLAHILKADWHRVTSLFLNMTEQHHLVQGLPKWEEIMLQAYCQDNLLMIEIFLIVFI
jgi:branched-subunit amino acid aminotransferase/4-amino-4-deoxychorismate lyase